MKIVHYERSGNLPAVPFVTFEGQDEVSTLEAAASFASRDAYPKYRGRRVLQNVLPYPLAGIRFSIEDRIARRRGSEDYRKLERRAGEAALNMRDRPVEEQRLVLIESEVDTAISALGHLSLVGDVTEHWVAPEGVDVVSTAADLSAQLEAAHLIA
jgi:hypothetical protein